MFAVERNFFIVAVYRLQYWLNKQNQRFSTFFLEDAVDVFNFSLFSTSGGF